MVASPERAGPTSFTPPRRRTRSSIACSTRRKRPARWASGVCPVPPLSDAYENSPYGIFVRMGRAGNQDSRRGGRPGTAWARFADRHTARVTSLPRGAEARIRGARLADRTKEFRRLARLEDSAEDRNAGSRQHAQLHG